MVGVMEKLRIELLKNKLGEKSFNKEEIDTIVEILEYCWSERNKKVSDTLKKRAECGLSCGRPKFTPPHFFRILCIYYELGYLELQAVCKMLSIGKSTFFRYLKEQNITTKDLKDSRYKKASDKQNEIYEKDAISSVDKWLRKNSIKFPKEVFNLLRTDCLTTMYLRLPNFYTDFQQFANECCFDTYNEFKESYFSQKKDILFSEDWQFDKVLNS